MREIGVGLVGLGHVGTGVLQILKAREAELRHRLGAQLVIRKIVVRELDKPRGITLPAGMLTDDASSLLADDSIDIVCELAGGVDFAVKVMRGALERGKHVVTANKAAIAARGDELFSLAVERGLDLHYEGSVCGGIPIVRTLREALVSDRLESIHGIVNGTTNFMLSQMEQGQSYDDALAQAQASGFAEADPTSDVSGADAAQKLCILASLAFGARVRPAEVATEGIEALGPDDLAAAKRLGFVIKLLASARRHGDGLELRVHPAMIRADSLLADVSGAFNAVLLVSEALGPSLLYGRGAGGMPTGVSVVSDLVDCARNLLAGSSGRVPLPCAPYVRELRIRPLTELRTAYHLRFAVSDEPGVLARITEVLARQGISISAVSQRAERSIGGEPVAIELVTHEALERDVQIARRELGGLSSMRAPIRLVRIEDGPPLARG